MSVFVRQQRTICDFRTLESWVVLSPIETRIKEKIDRVGVPLREWNISINYGVKTGFNDAFIITGARRKELIKQDTRSEEVIRPILRGRDIKRYSYEFADLWLIATFPSLKIDIEDYPAVKQHLLTFGYDRLKQTGDNGARKRTNNQWFETQDSISYWDDFSKQKIVWGEISDRTKFCLDNRGDFVCEATTFLMTGDSLLLLMCYLNSALSEYLFAQIGTTTGVGTVRWKKFKIEQLRIPETFSESERSKIESIGEEILLNRGKGQDTGELEKEIDDILYNKFDFTLEEISEIERK